jgi:hypothetical protein
MDTFQKEESMYSATGCGCIPTRACQRMQLACAVQVRHPPYSWLGAWYQEQMKDLEGSALVCRQTTESCLGGWSCY